MTQQIATRIINSNLGQFIIEISPQFPVGAKVQRKAGKDSRAGIVIGYDRAQNSTNKVVVQWDSAAYNQKRKSSISPQRLTLLEVPECQVWEYKQALTMVDSIWQHFVKAGTLSECQKWAETRPSRKHAFSCPLAPQFCAGQHV